MEPPGISAFAHPPRGARGHMPARTPQPLGRKSPSARLPQKKRRQSSWLPRKNRSRHGGCYPLYMRRRARLRVGFGEDPPGRGPDGARNPRRRREVRRGLWARAGSRPERATRPAPEAMPAGDSVAGAGFEVRAVGGRSGRFGSCATDGRHARTGATRHDEPPRRRQGLVSSATPPLPSPPTEAFRPLLPLFPRPLFPNMDRRP